MIRRTRGDSPNTVNRNLIRRAFRAYTKSKYEESTVILARIIEAGMRHPYPFFLLALNYLKRSQFNQLATILGRIRLIDPEYPGLAQLEAFIFFKSAPDRESAVSRYVEMMERFPDDRYLNRGFIRISRADDFAEFQRKATVHQFVALPRPGSMGGAGTIILNKRFTIPRMKWVMILLAGCIAAAVGIFLVRSDYFTGFPGLSSSAGRNLPVEAMERLDRINLDSSGYDLIERIKRSPAPVFYNSNEAVREDFSQAKLLLKRNRCNAALLLLNKLYHSNANYLVKTRIEFLFKFIADIEDRTFEALPFADLNRTPYLYRGWALTWEGKVANRKVKNGRMFFNLMVGYRDDTSFSGMTDVYAERDYAGIANGDRVRVNGIFVYPVGSDRQMYIVAKDIHKR